MKDVCNIFAEHHAPCGALLLDQQQIVQCAAALPKARSILTEPHPLLHEQSLPVLHYDDALYSLVQDMIVTMHSAFGIGLAAPQIGVLKRVFVMEVPSEHRSTPKSLYNGLTTKKHQVGHNQDHLHEAMCDAECPCVRAMRCCFVCINPTIHQKSSRQSTMEEGCLSVPNDTVIVKRPQDVCLEWHSINGQKYRRWFFGLEATCVQHEHDHLNGVTILQKK